MIRSLAELDTSPVEVIARTLYLLSVLNGIQTKDTDNSNEIMKYIKTELDDQLSFSKYAQLDLFELLNKFSVSSASLDSSYFTEISILKTW